MCGRKPSINHLRTFGCVAWVHILDHYMNKLDAESYACIMIGYSKQSKSYRLFDPVKQQIDEKTSSLGLLNSSSGPSYIDPFGIVEDTGSTVHLMSILTSLLTFFPKSNDS